jgi:hypothetical protein
MKVHIKPQRIIPAEYRVYFYEDRDYTGYIVQPQPYEDRLRPDIEEWLNTNAPGWSVNFDRGDWGEGPATVEICFSTEAQAQSFEAEFKNIPCPNSVSRGDCPHMGAALSLIDRKAGDGKGKCLHCGHRFQILTKDNREDFLKSNIEDGIE